MEGKRKIIWQKWIDPLNTNTSDIELLPVTDDEEDSRPYRDSYEERETKKPSSNHSGPLLVGPMGIIPLNEHNLPSKVFKFWMGHTNFDITDEVRDIIESIDGVETLDIFTRYRFRLAIGKAFKVNTVCSNITKALCQNEVVVQQKKPIDKDKEVGLMSKYLRTKYSYWAIFVLPNGKLEVAGSSAKEEVEVLVNKHKEIQGTDIIVSWGKI